ncbi:MAG: V-type ATPase subunit, partial [Candidatus Micrarchaeaceae archaeon]
SSNSSFDKISSYIIDYGEHNKLSVKEIMKEDSIEHILQRFMINSHYSNILQEALNTYTKTKNISDTINKINLLYYKSLSKSMRQLSTNGEVAARIIRLEIDMKNILSLIRGKALNLEYSQIQEAIIENGTLKEEDLKKLFVSSNSMESMISKINIFDLKTALNQYTKHKRLIGFEISMRSSIFKLALKILTYSVLSLTTVISYVYLKEIELSVLRAIIKSKEYNLDSNELSELIIWKE